MSVSIRQLFVPLAEEEKLPSFDTAFDSDRRPTVPTKPLYSSRRLKRERFDESGVPTCDKDSPKRQLQTRTNVAAERKKKRLDLLRSAVGPKRVRGRITDLTVGGGAPSIKAIPGRVACVEIVASRACLLSDPQSKQFINLQKDGFGPGPIAAESNNTTSSIDYYRCPGHRRRIKTGKADIIPTPHESIIRMNKIFANLEDTAQGRGHFYLLLITAIGLLPDG